MTLSQPEGALNQRVKLIVEAEQRQDVKNPDFSALENDFTILSQSKQSSASFRGGQTYYINRWTLSLKPLATGEFTLPGVRIGSERARPVSYIVLAPEAAPPPAAVRVDMFMELTQGYQLSAFQLVTQVAYAVDLSQAELQEPLINDALLFRIGPQTQSEEIFRDIPYQTIQQRYLVFPQRLGEYQVDPIFFNGADSSGNPIETESGSLTFDVIEPPVKPWLPASEIRIEEQWESSLDNLKVGDTLKRQLILEGHNLPAEWLPNIEMPSVDGISVYPKEVKTSQDGSSGVLVSRKVFDYELLLKRAGPQRLPAVKIPWWDNIRNAEEVSELPAKELLIEQFTATTTKPASTAPEPPITINEDNDQSDGFEFSEKVSWHSWLWAFIALICAAGWSLSHARIKRMQTLLQLQQAAPSLKKEEESSEADELLKETAAFNQLARACSRGQPNMAHQYLITWAQAIWPSVTIVDIDDVLFNSRDATLGYLLKDLEYHLQHPDDEESWQGDILLSQLQKIRYKSLSKLANKAADNNQSSTPEV